MMNKCETSLPPSSLGACATQFHEPRRRLTRLGQQQGSVDPRTEDGHGEQRRCDAMQRGRTGLGFRGVAGRGWIVVPVTVSDTPLSGSVVPGRHSNCQVLAEAILGRAMDAGVRTPIGPWGGLSRWPKDYAFNTCRSTCPIPTPASLCFISPIPLSTPSSSPTTSRLSRLFTTCHYTP